MHTRVRIIGSSPMQTFVHWETRRATVQCSHGHVGWVSADVYEDILTLTVCVENRPWAITEDDDGAIWIYDGERKITSTERVLWHRADATELEKQGVTVGHGV